MSSSGEWRLPWTLTAGGVQRDITLHLQQGAEERSYITEENLVEVLRNWVARGIHYDAPRLNEPRRPSIVYWGWIKHAGMDRLMRVAVSMDERRIASAFAGDTATEKMNCGDIGYFQRNYEQWEMRNEAESAL